MDQISSVNSVPGCAGRLGPVSDRSPTVARRHPEDEDDDERVARRQVDLHLHTDSAIETVFCTGGNCVSRRCTCQNSKQGVRSALHNLSLYLARIFLPRRSRSHPFTLRLCC